MCWRNCSAPFFAIWTSKSRPNARCFVHFDLQMRFAPQRHAIFRHRNFKKWSEAEVSCAFWLENVFCAKAACHFLTSQLQKTVRTWGVVCVLTRKCASRHSRVTFFDISTSKIELARECGVLCILTWKFASRHSGVPFSRRCWATSAPTAGFSDPTCRTSRATNHWKNTAIRDFPNIWRACIFFLVTLLACWSSFFWLDFSGLLFNCPYCRKVDF